MKKIYILLILMLSLSITFSSKITINDVKISTDVLNSGEDGEMIFTIENTHSSAITDCNVVISSELTLSQNNIEFKRLESGEKRTITLSYSAPQGLEAKTYNILITANFDDGSDEYSVQHAVLINLLKNNQLIVSNYSSTLLIDGTTNFMITLTNEGNSDLNNLFLELVLPEGFIPKVGTQYYLQSLKQGESTTISSEIFLEKTIEPKAYTIKLIKQADNYKDEDILNILSKGIPNLVMSGINLDPKIPTKGVMQTISVQYENIGSGKAYDVESKLNLDEEVVGVTREYLGTLEGDDLTSAIFDFIATERIDGNVSLTYKDEFGNEYSLIQEINYDLISSKSNISILQWLELIIGVVIAFFVYKKLKNTKQN